jgi:hypothetical protein
MPKLSNEILPEPVVTSNWGAQQMLGVGKSTVDKMIAAGELEVVPIWGRTLPTIASIRRLVERGGTQTPSPQRKRRQS